MVNTILFITHDNPVYEDDIYHGDSNAETFIRWNGQDKLKSNDKFVTYNSNIFVWHRKKYNTQFKYFGKVSKKFIFRSRDDNNSIIVDLFMDKTNNIIPYGSEAPIYDYKANNDIQNKKFKLECFNLLGFQNPKGNWGSGIMYTN